MLTKTYASAVFGVDARTITVEVNAGGPIGSSQNNYFMVGLPDNAVKEGRQRIFAAMKNIGRRVPGVKLVVNLAPADVRKEGSAYDLPIAVGMAASTGMIENFRLNDYVIMGELSLDGTLRPIKGALPIAIQARKERYKGLILPSANAREAAIVDDLEVYGIESLSDGSAGIDLSDRNRSGPIFHSILWHTYATRSCGSAERVRQVLKSLEYCGKLYGSCHHLLVATTKIFNQLKLKLQLGSLPPK